MTKEHKRLKGVGKALAPVMNVGKNGVTQGTIDLLDRELEQRELVKVKLNRGALSDEAARADRKAIAAKLASETRAKLIDQVGNMVVLWRKSSSR